MERKKLITGICMFIFLVGFGQFAHGALTSHGPIDPNTGFPLWYRDSTGIALQLCTEQPVTVPNPGGGPPIVIDPCLLDGVVPNPGQPIRVPQNSPDELFWWAAGAITPIIGGAGSADLVLAVEAAFAQEEVIDGDQISFTRVRIRVDAPVAGNYMVIHPYGVNFFPNVTPGGRAINFTSDIGIAVGNFRGALNGPIGPFLRWDTDYPVTFPEFPGMQFVGDPAVDHTVTGSPFGTNFFRVLADTNGDGTFETLVAFTDLFSVMGRIFDGALPIPKNDFDLDGKTDVVIYRGNTGAWYVIPSSGAAPYGVGWGGDPTDVPVPGDYDGDGKTDIAVYRSSQGGWYVIPSSGAAPYGIGWGGDQSDIPAAGDYDGDGKSDIAVYRAETGAWYVIPSSGAAPYGVGWGGDSTDLPVPGDYDGDGKTDLAVYRGSIGAWFVLPSSGAAPYGLGWGGDPTDLPVPGDYDGDGRTDLAIYRPNSFMNWFVFPSSGRLPFAYQLGGGSDHVPVSGDFDKDGIDDVAIYNRLTGIWAIAPSSTGIPYLVGWGGNPSDVPLTLWPYY